MYEQMYHIIIRSKCKKFILQYSAFVDAFFDLNNVYFDGCISC